MKWIDYTALTLAIIGAIVWGLIGVFQFNLVSFFFGENSWFSRLIYDLVGLSGLYLLTLFGRIGTRYVSICILFPLFYTLTIFIF